MEILEIAIILMVLGFGVVFVRRSNVTLRGLSLSAWLDNIDARLPPPTVATVQRKILKAAVKQSLTTVRTRVLASLFVVTLSPELDAPMRRQWAQIHEELRSELLDEATAEGYAVSDVNFELAPADPRVGRRRPRVVAHFGPRPAADAVTEDLVSPPPVHRPTRARGYRDGVGTVLAASPGPEPAWFLERADGKSYRLPFDCDVLVGAAAECNVQLDSALVSRRHVLLTARRQPASVTIEDLDSTNGTSVTTTAPRSGATVVRLRTGSAYTVKSDATIKLGPDDELKLLFRVETRAN